MDADVAQYERVTWKRSALREEASWAGRRRLLRWLAPLLALLAILLAGILSILHIQGDIEERAMQVLEANGIETSGLDFDAEFRHLEVSDKEAGVPGLPAGVTAVEIERILQADERDDDDAEQDGDINDVWVTATAAAAPVVALGVVDATVNSNGDSIVLAGTVPTEAQRNALIADAEATGLPVDADGLTVSGLEPGAGADGQVAKMGAVIGGLGVGAFTSASLSIGDDGPVRGTIEAANADVAASLASLSEGEDVTVSSPPVLGALDTDVVFDGERIVLNGTVLTDAQSAELEAAAAEVVGADNVTNNLVVSGLDEAVENADGRVAALGAAIGTFGGLTSADATMSDTDLTVNGFATDEASRTASVDAVSASSDAGLRPGGEITVNEPEISLQEEIDLLQAELDALQEEIRVNVVFASDSDVLSDKAKGTLDKVVDAMQRYPRPVVEVGGHTDSQGNDAYNIDLSQRRADSVVEYVGSQTSPDRLKPVGFGEAQPVADNTTEEGRLQNRRVEFIAKENF